MLVSHSPPVFSNSPPASFLSEYASFRVPIGSYRTTNMPSFCPKFKPLAIPKRPILVIRTQSDSDSSSCDEDIMSPTKEKKKVVFADDKGMSLTHIRVMTEPSNVPPFSLRFLSEVTHGNDANPLSEPWELQFAQPASDYVDFRKRLDTNKVSLENVMVKEEEKTLVGTIKVSNISFEKEVMIRSTIDEWKTHEDTSCKYIPTSSSSTVNAAYILYDTFSFTIPLPAKSHNLQFCVCFKTKDGEFWDNNNNQNYIVTKKIQPKQTLRKSLSNSDIYRRRVQTDNNQLIEKCVDAVQAKLDSWSEFASWTHLETSSPYW